MKQVREIGDEPRQSLRDKTVPEGQDGSRKESQCSDSIRIPMTEGIGIPLVVDEEVQAAGTYISFGDGGRKKNFKIA